MAYALQPANLTADKQAMLSVWGEALTHASAERFAWIYERNPFGPVSSWLVRESQRNSVAGSASVFPRTLSLAGHPVRAGVAGDLAVRKDHRVLGPAVMLQKATLQACDEGKFELVYGFPNAKAELVELRAGYKKLGPVRRMRRHLRSRDALARRTMPVIAAIAGPVVDLAVRVASREDLVGRGYRFAVEQRFDARFDRLWQAVKVSLPITGVRTSEYLNWRFASCPHKPYRILAMTGQAGGELSGYVVYYVREREAVICDVMASDFGATLQSLIAGFLRHQRTQPVDAIYCRYFGSGRLPAALKRFGFGERREGNVLYYVAPNSRFTAAELQEENWYLLDGDADL